MKLYVISAGVRVVVTEVFSVLQKQRGISLDKTLVYCMTPEVYDGEKLIDFGEPIVMGSNKHECVNHERLPEIKEGSNAILLGDTIEDILILKNLKMKNVITIGFLNASKEDSKKSLDKFLEVYDIVILNDGNINHASEIIKSIIGKTITVEYSKQGSGAERLAALLK